MRIGISSACLYPMLTEDAIKLLGSLGFSTFEIFFNSKSELENGYLHCLKEELDARQAGVVSIHPYSSGFESFLLFSEYERRFWDTVEDYKRFFYAAEILGANMFVVHGDKRSVVSEECYFDRFGRLMECGMQFGVTVAQENVNGFRSAHPAFLEKMIAALGERVRFILDIKQAVRAGYDPYLFCRVMGRHLAHIHINDNLGRENDCLLPGHGCMDYLQLKQILLEVQYTGDCVIEVYNSNYRNPEELRDAKKYLERIFLEK